MKLIEELFFIDKLSMLISYWHLTNPSGMGETLEKIGHGQKGFVTAL
jgi:hypothetical protein